MAQKIAIEHDVHDIARRVREYDDALRVYYNPQYSRFEVHDLRAKGHTFVLAAKRLDARIMPRLRAASFAERGPAAILRDLEAEEAVRGRRRDSEWDGLIRGMADDLRFAGKTVSGYGGVG